MLSVQWDEWDDFTADSSSKGARLQLYISRPRSSSASSSGGSPWQTLNSSRLLHMGSWQPPTPTLDEDAGDMAACLAQAALEQRSKAAGSAAPFKGGSSSAFGGAAAAGSTKSSLRSSKSSSNAGSIPDTQSLIASSSVRFAADVAPGDAAAGGAQPGQQCAACISLKTAAVLATIAEHQGGSAARAGSLTSSSSFSAPQPVRRLPGRRQTSPDLQQIVKQLKVGRAAMLLLCAAGQLGIAGVLQCRRRSAGRKKADLVSRIVCLQPNWLTQMHASAAAAAAPAKPLLIAGASGDDYAP